MKFGYIVRRCLLLTLALASFFAISGCWSSVEINKRFFVNMIILDKAEQGIELTLAIPLTNRLIPGMVGGAGSGTGNKEAHMFIAKKARNIGEAYRKIQSDISRKISFGQVRVIVVGHELAAEGMSSVLDFLARDPTIHINVDLFVTQGKAKEITAVVPMSERFTTDILASFVEKNIVITTTAADFLKSNYVGGDIVVPMLVFKKPQAEMQKEKVPIWMGTGGAAIFKQGKMVGQLSTKEMRGGLWILGQLTDSEISVDSPTDGKSISLIIHHLHTRINPRRSGEAFTFTVRVKAEAEVISSESDIDLIDLEKLKTVQQILNAKVEERISQAIEKTKQFKSDAFGFGKYMDWQYPREWKQMKPQWRDLYSSVKIEVQSDVMVKRLGTTQQPARIILPNREGNK
ncbi:Ger(x)C family spore germination protein [Cohnella sp. WQ 127256]|uniref:Ger(x)C family spore germination protein n=1 Tax=Cohnella sp. WQ 127256 TaxID=2938790 RepID=UPI002118F344|nr:Ger(x)C family spore germination protein [Cohnella sp. WQ 127256]